MHSCFITFVTTVYSYFYIYTMLTSM